MVIMKEQKLNIRKYGKYTLYIMFFLFFLLISKVTPLAGDDWVYAIGGTYCNPFAKAYSFYHIWSGRFLSELWGFLIAPHKMIWNILNAMIFTMLLIFIVKLVDHKQSMKTILFTMMLMLGVSSGLRMQTYTWIMGTTYVIPCLLFVIYIYYLKKYIFENVPFKKYKIVFYILNLCIPLYMENAAALVVGADLLVLIYVWFNAREKIKPMLTVTLFGVIGLLLIRFAPGAMLRMSRDHAAFNELSLFAKINRNWVSFIYYTFFNSPYIHIVLCIVVIVFITQNRKCFKYKTSYVLSIIVFVITIIVLLKTRTVCDFDLVEDVIEKQAVSEFSKSIGLLTMLCIIDVVVMIYDIFTCVSNKQMKWYYLFIILCALGANAVMLISPIFGTRSTIYTVYLWMMLAVMLLQEIKFNQTFNKVVIGLSSVIVFIFVQQYVLIYRNVLRVNQIRNGEIAYYQDHKDEQEAWIISFPKGSIHSANVYEGDDTHMYYFKEYYHINQDMELYFYKEK